LGAAYGLPVTHMDTLFWNPGWVPTPKPEMTVQVCAIATGENWVIDGNYAHSMDCRLARATAVIYIDYGRCFCLWRVVRRTLRHLGKVRPDLGEGCPEKWDFSFYKWVWDFNKRHRPYFFQKIKAHDNVTILRSRKEVAAFVAKYVHGPHG